MSQQSPIVLVIDDENIVQQYIVDMLRAMGYAACATADAEGATHLVTSLPTLRVLLCDICLKRCSGPELIREVLHQGPNLKVVFMTGGFSDVAFRSTDPVITKPFRFEDLQNVISAALRGSAPLPEQPVPCERRRWIRSRSG